MSDFLSVCREVAQIGGRQLLQHQTSFRIHRKGINDFVTDADLASQRAIHDALYQKFPDHGFLGEENLELPMTRNRQAEYCWVVDPLDGTLNYVHGLYSFSTSVALRRGDRIVAGAIYDPWMEELYSADENSASTLNGEPLKSSNCGVLEDALIVVSLPARVQPESPELADFLQLLYRARSVRRLGSAALNLCYVAAGRLDAYWATTVKLWDIAAGSLIVQQAGGVMTDINGQPLDLDKPRFVAAATSTLAEEMRKCLKSDPDRGKSA